MKKTVVYTLATIALALAITTTTFAIQSTFAFYREHGPDVSSEAHKANSAIFDAAKDNPHQVPGLAQSIGPAVRDIAIGGPDK
jgi:hypothetical protein